MAATDPAVDGEAFCEIPAEAILDRTCPAFDVHLRGPDDKPHVFFPRDATITANQRQQLRAAGQRVLLVREADMPAYRQYLLSHLDAIFRAPALTGPHRISLLYDAAVSTVDAVLQSPRDKNLIRQTMKMAKHAVTFLDEATALNRILAVTRMDYATASHSVNVAFYGIALARRMGAQEPVIRDLATALLLHDIGKSKIRKDLLHKPSALTKEEFETLKTHTVYGESILATHRELPALAAPMAAQHHERRDGSGYPHGLKENTIAPAARLAAIVDAFDAMTTRRPFRKPITTIEAIRVLLGEAGRYDKQLLGIFIRMLGPTAEADEELPPVADKGGAHG